MYKVVKCSSRSRSRSGAVIVPVSSEKQPPAIRLGDAAVAAAAERVAALPECGGEAAGIWTEGPSEDGGPRVIVVGLGKSIDVHSGRAAGRALLHALHGMHITSARLMHNEALGEMAAPIVRWLGEGLALANWRLDTFKQGGTAASGQLTLVGEDAEVHGPLRDGIERAGWTNIARDMAALPPNIATPAYIADAAQAMAKEQGLKCRVFQGAALKRHGFVGCNEVGKASEHKPCMIELVYDPPGRSRGTLALVGKTITFDSGGLSLKVHDTMRYMKYDKAAGCAVLAAMRAAAKLKPRHRIVGLLPAAENAISEVAYRVDDIIRFPNGVHVEVTNTDFEGRLVMADALIHACKAYTPDMLIDLGTLTGEIITALGEHTAGLWCRDEALRERIDAAAEASGEAVWPMPLTKEHDRAIASAHADIVNLNLSQPAKPSQCAAFLKRFVDNGIAWAHLDIAGVVHVTEPWPPYTVGPTGWGGRLLGELIASL